MRVPSTKSVLSYLFGSIAFLALPFIFSPDFIHSQGLYYNRHILRELTGYVLVLAFFYVHYFILIPRLFFKKKYLYFGLIVLSCFIVLVTVPKTIFPFERKPFIGSDKHFPEHITILMDIGHHLFIFLLVIFVSFNIRINIRLKQARKEKSDAELLYLKAQINPHFLFNSLNSIYSLAITKSDKTSDAVVMLSGLMRYVLSEAHNDFVSLSKELDYITDYIELQKIRFRDTVNITFAVTGDVEDKKIAPLLLIPFVENAFKYGINAEENSEISIFIELFSSTLKMKVKNLKVKTNIDENLKSGVGIENTKSRLELLYPQKHILSIKDNIEKYDVLLQLDLT